jgi:transcriptional regulator with XRE-family HTH domain
LLAKRIRELRQALGWTQQDLSRASGLSRSYISRLEMGDIALPSSDRLRALSTALGTAPDDLLQAAGFLDSPPEKDELPDVKVYLRLKYSIQDPRILQAVETIVANLQVHTDAVRAEGDQAELPIARHDQSDSIHH